MKKLLSVLMCVAMISMLTPSVFAADGLKDVFSGETWSFSESTVVSDYGALGNNTDQSPVELVTYTNAEGEEDDALSITRGGDNKNVNISFVSHTVKKIRASELEVRFSFKVSATKTKFKFVFRDEVSGDYNVFEAVNGYFYFLGNQVTSNTSYAADTWYDMQMLFNIPEGYGQLTYKESASGAGGTYHVLANKVDDTPDDNVNNAGMLCGKTETIRLGMGLEVNQGEVLIDNYYQNYADVDASILSSDDFSNGIEGWTAGNPRDYVTMEQSYLNDNALLKISGTTDETQSANTSMYQNITTLTTQKAALNTNYHFRFKFGGTTAKGTIGASLQTDNGDADSKTNTEIFILKNHCGSIVLFGGLVDNNGIININNEFGPRGAETLYEAEAVYNPSTGILTAVVTNEEGKQFIGTSTALTGVPNKFAFRNHFGYSDSPVAYFDDFKSGILDSNGPAFDYAEVKSGFADAASLDETVIFNYDRTINQSELSNATVTLGGEELSKEKYEISSIGNKVMVSLKDLAMGAKYKIGLSGVSDVISKTNGDVAEFEFETADNDIVATKPTLDGTVLSTKVNSYYANGKAIKLIVAVYNSEETMVEAVQVAEVVADDRAGETLSHDFKDILENTEDKTVKGFVWSDFGTMTPYAEAYINN